MVEFFQKMKEFIDICDVKNTVIESLTELKRTFCISSALFYKFTRYGDIGQQSKHCDWLPLIKFK